MPEITISENLRSFSPVIKNIHMRKQYQYTYKARTKIDQTRLSRVMLRNMQIFESYSKSSTNN